MGGVAVDVVGGMAVAVGTGAFAGDAAAAAVVDGAGVDVVGGAAVAVVSGAFEGDAASASGLGAFFEGEGEAAATAAVAVAAAAAAVVTAAFDFFCPLLFDAPAAWDFSGDAVAAAVAGAVLEGTAVAAAAPAAAAVAFDLFSPLSFDAPAPARQRFEQHERRCVTPPEFLLRMRSLSFLGCHLSHNQFSSAGTTCRQRHIFTLRYVWLCVMHSL